MGSGAKDALTVAIVRCNAFISLSRTAGGVAGVHAGVCPNWSKTLYHMQTGLCEHSSQPAPTK